MPSSSFLSKISDKAVYLITNMLEIAFNTKLCSAEGPKMSDKKMLITDPIPPTILIRSKILNTHLVVWPIFFERSTLC